MFFVFGVTGFIVAIPVFFDVGFIILVPIVYSLAKKTGKSLLHYGIPLLAGLAVTHSFIPPTPGPIAVAELVGAELGWVI
ncbi:GntP family permease, partial [Rossellomorea aquimaris]|uniref:GntP family permease n=1 Tax=Rossellomorea aquimaris TaxID=189382 RepID=UPI000ADA12AA